MDEPPSREELSAGNGWHPNTQNSAMDSHCPQRTMEALPPRVGAAPGAARPASQCARPHSVRYGLTTTVRLVCRHPAAGRAATFDLHIEPETTSRPSRRPAGAPAAARPGGPEEKGLFHGRHVCAYHLGDSIDHRQRPSSGFAVYSFRVTALQESRVAVARTAGPGQSSLDSPVTGTGTHARQ